MLKCKLYQYHKISKLSAMLISQCMPWHKPWSIYEMAEQNVCEICEIKESEVNDFLDKGF